MDWGRGADVGVLMHLAFLVCQNFVRPGGRGFLGIWGKLYAPAFLFVCECIIDGSNSQET